MISGSIARLKKEQRAKKLNFNIKCTNEKQIGEIFLKLKKKKSEGCDGVSQAQLAAGAPTLTKSLVKIFNKSITEGKFPSAWKEAAVTPVLKKGDKSVKANYRPDSCLPAAAQLLELVVCTQTTKFVESNKTVSQDIQQKGY